MDGPDSRISPPESANTLSYVTVELRYFCIMWSKCIGYRQNLGNPKCWPNYGIRHTTTGKSNIQARIEKMLFPVEINRNQCKTTIRPKDWKSGNRLEESQTSRMGHHLRSHVRGWEIQNPASQQEKEKVPSPHPILQEKEKCK